MIRILIIDDEIATCSLLSRILSHFGYKTRFTDDGEAATHIMETFAPHLIITDLTMPMVSGTALLKMSKDRFPLTPVLALTNGSVIGEEVEHLGFDGYILKPPVISELLEEVKVVLEKKMKSILMVDGGDGEGRLYEEALSEKWPSGTSARLRLQHTVIAS